MSPGRIRLVPTPIGNLGDITQRAVDALREADLIACEDTRHTSRLLSHLGIDRVPLISLHEHNESRRVPEIIAAVAAGKTVAVVSDAGMPGISDPGYCVVKAALEAELPLEVLPGPSSVLTALVGSGLPVHAFRFHGFLPIKKGKRLCLISEGLAADGTSIYFESPHRILSTLELLANSHPSARICIARELTKKFETYHRGTAAELLTHFQSHLPKGEIVLLVAP